MQYIYINVLCSFKNVIPFNSWALFSPLLKTVIPFIFWTHYRLSAKQTGLDFSALHICRVVKLQQKKWMLSSSTPFLRVTVSFLLILRYIFKNFSFYRCEWPCLVQVSTQPSQVLALSQKHPSFAFPIVCLLRLKVTQNWLAYV